jgi:hypothetical protein
MHQHFMVARSQMGHHSFESSMPVVMDSDMPAINEYGSRVTDSAEP